MEEKRPVIQIPLTEETIEPIITRIIDHTNKIMDTRRKKEQEAKEFLNSTETAKYIGVSYAVFQRIQAMGLPKVVIDGRTIYKRSTVDRFMESLEI